LLSFSERENTRDVAAAGTAVGDVLVRHFVFPSQWSRTGPHLSANRLGS
jgi:hypothetical protein